MKTPVILALLCACLCGCSRKIYVPVERVSEHTARDTVYVLRQSVDSVVRADSVVTERRGDTVFVQRVSTRYRLRTLTDTLYRTRTDTVLQKERDRSGSPFKQQKQPPGVVAVSGISSRLCGEETYCALSETMTFSEREVPLVKIVTRMFTPC